MAYAGLSHLHFSSRQWNYIQGLLTAKYKVLLKAK